MKKVRFKSPKKQQLFTMNDSECHSPRPFIEQELRTNLPELTREYPKVLPYSSDPIQRYENSNSRPYPAMSRTSFSHFPEKEPCWKPSDDLNLSMLDALNHEPRPATFCKSILKGAPENQMQDIHVAEKFSVGREKLSSLSSIDNNKTYDPPNVLVKDNSFFLRRDNLDKYHFNIKPLQNGSNKIKLGKENDPLAQKADIMTGNFKMPPKNSVNFNPTTVSPIISDSCRCHHCFANVNLMHYQKPPVSTERQVCYQETRESFGPNCICSAPRNVTCFNCDNNKLLLQNVCKSCSYSPEPLSPKLRSTVDQKIMAIERYEKSKQYDSMEIEKQTNASQEKKEPTVADLFKIIKLQNEQLQLLQEKVDKFMSMNKQIEQPTITCSTEHVAVNTVENDQHKMSIGVMTSFEMIRTSTVINKEVVKHNENAQIQCNKAQISIKEVVSKPVNMNFLDGIIPNNVAQTTGHNENEHSNINMGQQTEEKTLNEMSLCNVQVDNATTPLMSPDQTLYLDVRDYSDSEASSNDQSNVGWTYYNKVMTHVNGMLQDSEMPSSASAMYRNMRQQCVQMQIDKTNVSVTKRVKFGDDPLGLHQQMLSAPATETSLKMNQLAAKYLKSAPQVPRPVLRAPAAAIDMSFATRNYMEKHRLLQGMPAPKSPQPGEIPRFLDITALKQQPKFL